MATLVGTQVKFHDALFQLCELDYDAIEAYEAAINRIENEEYKSKMREFKSDHQRHTVEISNLLNKHQAKSPNGPSAKQILTQGKVVLANLFGDKAILKAMLTNEMDTNKAYEAVLKHDEKWEDSIDILKRGLADERKHRQWIQTHSA